MLSEVDPGERLVVVEDSSELRPRHPHLVALESRPPNIEGAGEVELRTLVRQALRMRPDRLVVGEVRGGEVVDLLAALNTGHEGGCGTLHANSATDVPARVEALALAAGLGREAAHSQLAAALDVVLHLDRGADGRRRLREVAMPERSPTGEVSMTSAWRLADGRCRERLRPGVRAARGPARRMSLLAALSAGLVVALLVPAAPPGGVERGPRSRRLLLVGLGFGLSVALFATAAPRTATLSLLAVSTVLAAVRLWQVRQRDREALTTSRAVQEICEVLAAELASGQPPGVALDHAAETWPPLAATSEAFRVGADVPAAFRQLAARPGAADLRLVAAAWQVAHRTGQGLAVAVTRVAAGVRAAEESRRVVRGELASARTTARLIAALPFLSLTVGSGSGSHPWRFLLDTVPRPGLSGSGAGLRIRRSLVDRGPGP